MNLWQDKRSRQLNTSAWPRRVIGVVGATGGLGASSLAAALAVRASSNGLASLLIDAHPHGGGVDVCLGLDTEPGLRWPDLASVRGEIDARAVLEDVPSVGECRVLSWDRVPSRALADHGLAIAFALTQAANLSVIDLPGAEADGAAIWWGLCDIVLVCGYGVRQMAAAAVVLELLEMVSRHAQARLLPGSSPQVMGKPRVHAVLRESAGKVDRDRAAATLGLPILGAMPRDAGVEAALTRGEPVGGRSGPTAKLSDELLGDILGWARAA